jgi:uncharacterized RDD family membrane protein YckC
MSYGNMPPPPPNYGDAPPPGYGYGGVPAPSYANWGQRVGAYLIDLAPLIVLEIIVFAVGNAAVSFLIYLIWLGIVIYNRWYQAGTTGQSWGKKALGLKLVSESTGQPIGPGMAFARDICHILDSLACFIGWLFPLWDAKRQTFADKIISTVVIPA